jgi:hypothetical protein
LHEPERKGLWTVSEDDRGEQEAEWEDEVRRGRVGVDVSPRCLSRWTREEEGEMGDEFIDVDLFDQKVLSCSTSCTSEEPSQCITPSLDSDNLDEDVFFGSLTDLQRSSRTKRTSTCSFENAMVEEDEVGLFFAPTMVGRAVGRPLDVVDLKRDGRERESRVFEDW